MFPHPPVRRGASGCPRVRVAALATLATAAAAFAATSSAAAAADAPLAKPAHGGQHSRTSGISGTPRSEGGGVASYQVDLGAIGPTLDSIGAQSTAGTARLLRDYPEPQRSDILDLLFKPNHGASLQHLKVEIGGDGQISCGAEPTAIRSQNGSDTNFNRGYEQWLMAEAKRRNPDIVLLGLVYSFPWWVNPASPSSGNSPYASNATEALAAGYVASWVSGMRDTQNLTIDWVGLFNEREFTDSYILALRSALDDAGHTATRIVGSDRFWEPVSTDYLNNPDIRGALAALSQHYPHCDARPGVKSQQCGKTNANALAARARYGVRLWSSEDYSCWTDSVGAGVWAAAVNSNFIGGNITMTSAWHLISAFYPTVAFWNEGLMSATQPWSGRYVASPTLWATAHTTQFTTAGVSRYVPPGRGSGVLQGGGTYVTLVDAAKGDVTIVVETAGSTPGPFSAGNCNGQLSYGPATAAQNVTFQLSPSDGDGALAQVPSKLTLWRTQLGTNPVASASDPESRWFEKVGDVPVGADGAVSFSADPDAVYTLSTVQTARKGAPSSPMPPAAAFPLPYSDDFDSVSPPQQPRYFSDMEAAFEVRADSVHPGNQVLFQASPRPDCCNFIPKLDGPVPLTIIGSSAWENVAASVSVRLPAGAFAAVAVRAQYAASSFFRGGLGLPTGLVLALDGDRWALVTSVASLGGGGIPARCDAPPKGACLASGSVTGPARNGWHTLRLAASNRTATVTVNGVAVAPAVPLPDGVATGGGYITLVSDYAPVAFDNFGVAPSGTLAPSRCGTAPAAGQQLVSVGCGEASAANGSNFVFGGGDGGVGPISIRSAPHLCLEVEPAPASAINADAAAPSGGTRPETAPSAPPTSPSSPPLSSTSSQDCSWNASAGGHGRSVAVSADGHFATWPSGMGRPGCDSVALMTAALPRPSTFWVHVIASKANFVDIGWCAPDIDVSGATWMGWQAGKAWVYRGFTGGFKVANGTQDQGVPYGPTFGAGANVTAMLHSAGSVEFALNGKSLGPIALPPGHSIPDNAVPCAGACDGVVLGLAPGGPPPPPPLPPARGVRLAMCSSGTPAQQWRYDASLGQIAAGNSPGKPAEYLSIDWSGDFAPATVVASPSSPLWWSPDPAIGLVHGRSNAPMDCPCLAACGV